MNSLSYSSVKVRKCRSAISIRGYQDAPVSDVGLFRCAFEQAAQPNVLALKGATINGKAL